MILNEETRELLESEALDAELRFTADYSGRYMYGRECVGVIGSFRDIVSFVSSVSRLAGEACDSPHTLDLQINEFVSSIGNCQVDSYGLDTVCYWPSVKVGEE